MIRNDNDELGQTFNSENEFEDKTELKCECNKKGILFDDMIDMYDKDLELPFVAHEPNQCKCKNNLKHYLRNHKVIVLCSCCVLSSDKEI